MSENDTVQPHELLAGRLRSHSSERRAVHKDGHLLWTKVQLFPEANQNPAESHHLLAIIHDLTELRSAQAALEQAETARTELARRLTTA